MSMATRTSVNTEHEIGKGPEGRHHHQDIFFLLVVASSFYLSTFDQRINSCHDTHTHTTGESNMGFGLYIRLSCSWPSCSRQPLPRCVDLHRGQPRPTNRSISCSCTISRLATNLLFLCGDQHSSGGHHGDTSSPMPTTWLGCDSLAASWFPVMCYYGPNLAGRVAVRNDLDPTHFYAPDSWQNPGAWFT